MPQVVVPLKGGSDADATHRPSGPAYSLVDPPTLYLEKIGQQWMQARGEAKLGVKYTLEALPTGYALYQRPRANVSHVDKFLFGHPSHKPFDSPNRFFPHFEYVMDNEGSSIGCPCTVCNPKGGVLPRSEGSRSSSKRRSNGSSSGNSTPLKRKMSVSLTGPSMPIQSMPVQQQGRPKKTMAGTDTNRVDEEGTPDVYRNLIDKLKRYGAVDDTIMEPLSMDWRAEQSMLPDLLKSLQAEPQWIPRVGDIVLFISEIPEGLELLQHEQTGEHMFWDPESDEFMGEPRWQAGLVGQTPTEDLTTEDAVRPSVETQNNVSLSGVRVEPLPKPNDANKSFSKRYKYVPVHQTRPFILWKDYIGHLPEDEWHPTIKNALTTMAAVSLVGKHRFRGTWPDAQIYCKAIYIGSEMLVVGDTVRLLPKGCQTTPCTDILVINSIRLKLSNLDKTSGNDYDEGRPYNSEVWIFGTAYSTDSSRSSKEWYSAANAETPKAAEGYAKWYPLHPSSKELAVPFSRVLGRLFEHDTINLWLPTTSGKRDLSYGQDALLSARSFARANDARISATLDATWFWADNRAEALDLKTVNGLDVSRFDTDRNPSELRKRIKIIEGVGVQQSQSQSQTRGPGRGESTGTVVGGSGSGTRDLGAFMHVAPGAKTLPVRISELQRRQSVPRANTKTGERGSRVIDLGSDDDEQDQDQDQDDDEEDEEDIKKHMRVVSNTHAPSTQRKAKVMVVID